jgi:hypothetical protein
VGWWVGTPLTELKIMLALAPIMVLGLKLLSTDIFINGKVYGKKQITTYLQKGEEIGTFAINMEAGVGRAR